MEGITFYEQINLFLENKGQRKSLACIRKHEPAYATLKPAYVGPSLLT